jgi:hypothetical protein
MGRRKSWSAGDIDLGGVPVDTSILDAPDFEHYSRRAVRICPYVRDTEQARSTEVVVGDAHDNSWKASPAQKRSHSDQSASH